MYWRGMCGREGGRGVASNRDNEKKTKRNATLAMRSRAFLALNAGSSSLKASLFDESLRLIASATVERVGSAESTLSVRGVASKTALAAPTHASALSSILSALSVPSSPAGVGHRIVHGGERSAPALWCPAVEADVRGASPLAPLHNPPALAAAAAAARAFSSSTPHVAVFDTAFHVAGLSPSAYTYALPPHLAAARARPGKGEARAGQQPAWPQRTRRRRRTRWRQRRAPR